MLTVQLPWPPSQLSPNARMHWAALAKAKKRFRARCALEALAQGAKRLSAERLAVHLQFYPPDHRHRDHDNMVAAIKSGLDGLSDVLGVDDSRWTLTHEVSSETGGFVGVEVSAL